MQYDLEQLKIDVAGLVASSDVAEARVLLAELATSGINPEGIDEAARLMRQLLFLRLPQLEPEQAAWLLQHYVLEGFEVGDYNFPARVQDTLSLLFDTDKRADLLHHFLTAVESSDELLGDKPLVIDAVEMAPMVQNWIKDYNYWPTENKLRQSIDAVNYVSKAPNPQKLSAEDRALLIKFLGWYDEIRNSLFDYEASEDIDLEQYPDFDPRLLTASVDEFESPEVAKEVLNKAMTARRANPLGGVPIARTPLQTTFVPPVSTPRPNIQGVLSNAPIKKDNMQREVTLPVKQEVPKSAPAQLQPKIAPTSVMPKSSVSGTSVPSVVQKNETSSASTFPKKPLSQEAALPAKVPENLPMIEPEDLPAVVRPKVPKQPFAKPAAPVQKPQSSSLPPTLNMDKIQAEVARKKNTAQEDIDQRLANLKKRSANKN